MPAPPQGIRLRKSLDLERTRNAMYSHSVHGMSSASNSTFRRKHRCLTNMLLHHHIRILGDLVPRAVVTGDGLVGGIAHRSVLLAEPRMISHRPAYTIGPVGIVLRGPASLEVLRHRIVRPVVLVAAAWCCLFVEQGDAREQIVIMTLCKSRYPLSKSEASVQSRRLSQAVAAQNPAEQFFMRPSVPVVRRLRIIASYYSDFEQLLASN